MFRSPRGRRPDRGNPKLPASSARGTLFPSPVTEALLLVVFLVDGVGWGDGMPILPLTRVIPQVVSPLPLPDFRETCGNPGSVTRNGNPLRLLVELSTRWSLGNIWRGDGQCLRSG